MVNILKFQMIHSIIILSSFLGFFFMQLFPKILSRMANSVDPDQTASWAVWSGSALLAYVILSEMVVWNFYCIIY